MLGAMEEFSSAACDGETLQSEHKAQKPGSAKPTHGADLNPYFNTQELSGVRRSTVPITLASSPSILYVRPVS